MKLWSPDPDLDDVEFVMNELATGDLLGTIVSEHLATGGKRLRARLALAAVEALGRPRQHGIVWAASCELFHNASLVHDDLQDGDAVRRGKPTVWVKHGAAQAINAGDVLLMLPWRAVEHVPAPDATRWHLSRALARRGEAVVRGQADELAMQAGWNTSWETYEHAVVGKTSALFALPVEGAALIAGWTPGQAQRLGDALAELGLAFQIQDDMLDLWGAKGRGRAGCDLAEGKVSAVVVEHLRLHPEDTHPLLATLRRPREETTQHEIDAWIRRFEDGGAVAALWQRLDAVEHRLASAPELAAVPALRNAVLDLFRVAIDPILHTHPDAALQQTA